MSTDCIFRSETSEETEEDSCSSLEISSGDVLVDVCSDDTTAGQIQDTSDAKGYLPNSIAFKLYVLFPNIENTMILKDY